VAKPCSICAHPQRAVVDADLLRAIPFRTLAERHGVSSSTLYRYAQERPLNDGELWYKRHQAQSTFALAGISSMSLRHISTIFSLFFHLMFVVNSKI
jgi:hypothetical protein